MKQFFSTLRRAIRNRSLRWKIMTSLALALTLTTLALLATVYLDNYSMRTLGDSYISNAELTHFTQELTETQRAMETYINYHTFESIDNYYAGKIHIEEICDTMQNCPSVNELRQTEYLVHQLALSFIYYSNKSVSARRANNTEELKEYFKITLECYNTLMSKILELNNLRLQENAQTYEKNHQYISFTRSLSIIFFVVFSFTIFILLYLIVSSLMAPLAEISRVAERVSNRDFDIPLFNNKTTDEIGNICNAFDGMIISIREYIDTIWEKAQTESELREKEIEMQSLYTDAQLRALQNQINPHFLFNTLNTGAQLAMMENADKTCYFIEQVADFFRYNIQRQDSVATINEELGIIDNFVYIMKVRFGNRLVFTKDIPNMDFPQQIPVMTLQPIVENCIKHSLENPTGIVNLKVEKDEKFITITVSDNGSGMPEETKAGVFKAVEEGINRLPAELVNAVNKKKEPGQTEKRNGTGLISVFLRLKIHFHRDDIFDITQNDDNIGTKFIIRIPINV